MADLDNENTPFLASRDDTESDDEIRDSSVSISLKQQPANSHFKRAIKILTIHTAVISVVVLGLLIACFVILHVEPVSNYSYFTREVVQQLGIAVLVSAIIAILMSIFTTPILIGLIVNLAFLIILFIYSGNIFGRAWPESHWCHQYWKDPESVEPIQDPRCVRQMTVIKNLLATSAGLSFALAVLYLILLVFRIAAVKRAKFWKRKSVTGGYTLQLTLKVMQQGDDSEVTGNGSRPESRNDSAEGQLIDA